MANETINGVYVIGTDTGVGKTIVCAGLLKLLQGAKKPLYWKPVQTGTIVGDDTKAVKSLTDFPAERFLEPVYRFPEPLSPHMAAQKWGKKVELDELVSAFNRHKKDDAPMVIEGAGGLLVPFNEKVLQLDFIKAVKLPVIVVSEDRVGAINQTLLTVNAARAAGVNVLGVILTRARRTLGNAEAIAQFGKIQILAELDPTEDSRNVIAQVGANEALRKLFQVDSLPA